MNISIKKIFYISLLFLCAPAYSQITYTTTPGVYPSSYPAISTYPNYYYGHYYYPYQRGQAVIYPSMDSWYYGNTPYYNYTTYYGTTGDSCYINGTAIICYSQ